MVAQTVGSAFMAQLPSLKDVQESFPGEPLDEEDGRNDIEGLVGYLGQLKKAGVRLTETTYVINKWALGGIIPMTHHGFILKTSREEYFTLDFGRRGIVWDVYDELPGLPDNTTYTKVYPINVDPWCVQRYCEDTKPFVWGLNDCESWAKGLLQIMNVDGRGSFSAGNQSGDRMQRVGPCVGPCEQESQSGQLPMQSGLAAQTQRPTRSFRKQRTGTCI
mmetsp:Transcript_91090/g.167223  ORF Transcript_91090/g.167223 Transcript_91090/m.167223 type:complete len:219 (-) Transcript_91090:133-789(-)